MQEDVTPIRQLYLEIKREYPNASLFIPFSEFMAQLEKTSSLAVKNNPRAAQQATLFPESNPLLDEPKELDVNELSPIEALGKLFEWQKRYSKS